MPLSGPVAHCVECHTPMGEKGPLFDTHLGAGGFEFHGPWGTSVSANLTGGCGPFAFTRGLDLATPSLLKIDGVSGSPQTMPTPMNAQI